jgi:heat shock protein HslJ
MDQERLYLEMLQKSRSYSMNAEQLIIVTAIGQLVYSNLPIEPPPDPSMLLFNRTWFLTSINNNAAIPGYEPRAYFSSDGSLNGFTGCNLYSARFITDMSSIAIAPIAKTEDPCNDPILTQERAFINALQVVTEFKVDATTMQLIGINGVLNFTITPPKSPVPSPIHPATETPVPTPTTSATQTADPQATSAAG